MFRSKQWQQYDGKSLRIVHDPQPKSFACNAWFEAASAARARLVMLHTPGTEAAVPIGLVDCRSARYSALVGRERATVCRGVVLKRR
jgi:hypothetical protein